MQVLERVCQETGTDMHMLLLEWCYKVLAHVMLNLDASELKRVLSFYEANIGVRLKHLVQAVAPQLLEEVVWLMGESDGDAGTRR